MRIAALQSDIVWEDPRANFARLSPWIDSAAGAGARLLLLPEMFACGFSMSTARIAEPPEGPTTLFLRDEARRSKLWIGGTLPELPSGADKPFNTFVLAGPAGELFRYRKIHPFSFAREHEHYAAGTDFVSVTIEGLRCTLFVCYDLRFADEFWKTAATTDVYLVPANWPERRRHHWTSLLLARAIENQAYVVGVNRVGTGNDLTYLGDSRIIDPWGEILSATAGQEALLLADVEAERVKDARARFPLFQDRR